MFFYVGILPLQGIVQKNKADKLEIVEGIIEVVGLVGSMGATRLVFFLLVWLLIYKVSTFKEGSPMLGARLLLRGKDKKAH